MKTETELLIEYVRLSWDHEFPPSIEAALEKDYVKNHHMYTEDTIKQIATLLLIAPDASADQVIELIKTESRISNVL
jgi:hypothetical protein